MASIKIKNLYLFILLFLIFICGCMDKKGRLFNYQIKSSNPKMEIIKNFGKPDSIIALSEFDTTFLYRFKSGCVEWRFTPKELFPYQTELNDSCKIKDGGFETYDRYEGGEVAKNWENEIDYIGRGLKIDSIILIRELGHWGNRDFILTGRDTGQSAYYFKLLLEKDVQNKRSVIGVYSRKLDFIVGTKFGNKKHTIYLGSYNYPDSSYAELIKELDATTRYLRNSRLYDDE